MSVHARAANEPAHRPQQRDIEVGMRVAPARLLRVIVPPVGTTIPVRA